MRTDTPGPSPPLTPDQALASFQLADGGLDIQLVAAEPLIQDPVFSVFDGHGHLWVVEMRGFMNDVNRGGEDQPIGRISILTDNNGDGRMDSSIIYADSLIMPRSVAPLPGGALIAHKNALWMTHDRNGDLRADDMRLMDSTYAKNGLPEHSDNGLWRGMDNWYYNAKSMLRYQWINNQWRRDSTEFRGQWGICHDDFGRLIYNYNWSQLHGDLVPPNYLNRNPHHQPTTGIDYGFTLDRRIYPIRATPAVNRGYVPGTLDDQGRLLEFTAACAPFYYRAETLPAEYYGNVFVCEPSGHLIKRNVVRDSGLLVTAFDPHPGREFLASTDERFRPVFLNTGPDGALYVTDMYRGLIQHGAYVTPYLKEQTLQRQLEAPVHYGRIWRIVPKGWKPKLFSPLATASDSVLVSQLSNSNGWVRDQAQKLLIERKAPVAPAINTLVGKSQQPLGKLHALWTLAGLEALSSLQLAALQRDSSILVKNTALRLAENFALNDRQFSQRLADLCLKELTTAHETRALQIALSSYAFQPADKILIAQSIFSRFAENSLLRDAMLSSLKNEEFQVLSDLLETPEYGTLTAGKEVVLEMLSRAIMVKGKRSEIVPLLNGTTNIIDWQQQAILHGFLTADVPHPISCPSPPKFFNSAVDKSNLTELQISILRNKFSWPGHAGQRDTTSSGSLVLTAEELKSWSAGRQQYLSVCAGCHGTDGRGIPRFAPKLRYSSWVADKPKRLVLILLHGLEGPIEVDGIKYGAPDILPVMPSHSTLSDETIADILTYIRNDWGHQAGAVTRRLVGATRVLTQGRVTPWTASELEDYLVKNDTLSLR